METLKTETEAKIAELERQQEQLTEMAATIEEAGELAVFALKASDRYPAVLLDGHRTLLDGLIRLAKQEVRTTPAVSTVLRFVLSAADAALAAAVAKRARHGERVQHTAVRDPTAGGGDACGLVDAVGLVVDAHTQHCARRAVVAALAVATAADGGAAHPIRA